MEPADLEKIFEVFTQTDAGLAAGGTGLGLTISDRLIRSMGDALKVASVPGQGSRFFFALPLVPGPAPSETEAVAADHDSPLSDSRLAEGQEITALVADDSTVSRRILAALLESAGIQVITAAGGEEALELARTHRPDIAFMDLRMADIDGLEATRRLQADSTTAHIPVIAVTANALAGTRQAAHAAGCVDYLSKPISAEALFAAVRSHLGVRFVDGSAPPPNEPALSDAGQRRAIAKRVIDAVAVGDVTDLEAFARELGSGNEAEAVIGHRITRLIGNFDFDGLSELARAWGGDEPARGRD
jgi:CheY-like chemotaxis protein